MRVHSVTSMISKLVYKRTFKKSFIAEKALHGFDSRPLEKYNLNYIS